MVARSGARDAWCGALVDQVSEIELLYYISSGTNGEVERKVMSFDMRWYLHSELVHLLTRAGFCVRAIYGDFDRSPLTDQSPEQIVCAERVTTIAT